MLCLIQQPAWSAGVGIAGEEIRWAAGLVQSWDEQDDTVLELCGAPALDPGSLQSIEIRST